MDIKPPTPGLFSFNNPLGACPKCRGFGRTIGIDLDRALPDKRLSIARGVVKPFQSGQSAECQRDLIKAASRQEIDLHTPFEDLSKADQKFVVYGEGGGPGRRRGNCTRAAAGTASKGISTGWKRRPTRCTSAYCSAATGRTRFAPECDGGRFQPATLNFPPRARRGMGPGGQALFGASRVSTSRSWRNCPSRSWPRSCQALVLPPNDPSAEMLQQEVVTRLRYLIAVGLGYLNLDRPTRTLSGGEIERVNLTTCLGASLVNTLFVLDEPSVGPAPARRGPAHPRHGRPAR